MAEAEGDVASSAAGAEAKTPTRKFTRAQDKSPGSGGKKTRKKKAQKWVPPILPRYQRRDVSPGPGAYNLGVYSPTYHKDITHGKMARASLTQDTRDFYFGANQAKSSAMFGRDSPGPVYQAGGSPGKPFPGPRASQSTAPGFSGSGAIQRPFLEPTCSPGPKYLYKDTTLKRTEYDFSMASRAAKPPEPERSPGPVYNPNPDLIGNINDNRAGAFTMTARPYEREKGAEPGPGAFEVTTTQLDATKTRLPKHYIAIRYDDRGPDIHRMADKKGKIKVPKYPTPGPETGNGKSTGRIGENLSKHGGFSQGPGHAAAIDNMSLPGSDKGFTMSLIIP